MAQLGRCPTCDHEVSSEVYACPNCGHPLFRASAPAISVPIRPSVRAQFWFVRTIKWAFILTAIIGFVIVFLSIAVNG